MVELIPRKEKKAVLPWQNILFFASFIMLAAVAVVYIIFFFSVNRAVLTIEGLEGEIAKRGTAAEKQVEREVFEAEAKINFFSQIFDNHRRSSKLFPKLEGKIHPQTWFDFFDLDTDMGVLQLRGQTLNFQTLSQQVSALRAESAIKSIELADLSLGEEGEADFTLTITFDLQTFK